MVLPLNSEKAEFKKLNTKKVEYKECWIQRKFNEKKVECRESWSQIKLNAKKVNQVRYKGQTYTLSLPLSTVKKNKLILGH